MPSAQPFGLDNPALEITLTGKDGKELGTIKFAKIERQADCTAAAGRARRSDRVLRDLERRAKRYTR